MFRADNEQKKRFRKLLAGIVITVLAGLLYYAVVRIFDVGIPCPFHALTGLNCPGCGTSRMAIAILKLDFLEAFSCQPVLFCFIVPLGACFAKMGIDYVKTGNRTLCLWQNIVVYTAIVCLLLYCVYVNIIMIANK